MKRDPLFGVDFHQQKHIANFYPHELLPVIEIDGAHNYTETMPKYAKKTEYRNYSIKIYREKVLDNTAFVLQKIRAFVVAFRLKHPGERLACNDFCAKSSVDNLPRPLSERGRVYKNQKRSLYLHF